MTLLSQHETPYPRIFVQIHDHNQVALLINGTVFPVSFWMAESCRAPLMMSFVWAAQQALWCFPHDPDIRDFIRAMTEQVIRSERERG